MPPNPSLWGRRLLRRRWIRTLRVQETVQNRSLHTESLLRISGEPKNTSASHRLSIRRFCLTSVDPIPHLLSQATRSVGPPYKPQTMVPRAHSEPKWGNLPNHSREEIPIVSSRHECPQIHMTVAQLILLMKQIESSLSKNDLNILNRGSSYVTNCQLVRTPPPDMNTWVIEWLHVYRVGSSI